MRFARAPPVHRAELRHAGAEPRHSHVNDVVAEYVLMNGRSLPATFGADHGHGALRGAGGLGPRELAHRQRRRAGDGRHLRVRGGVVADVRPGSSTMSAPASVVPARRASPIAGVVSGSA